jgi:hypothetical protein
MLTCIEAERLIARAADEPAALGDTRHDELDRHVSQCAACRAALETQRQVARTLHLTPQFPVPAGFQSRLSARLDQEGDGWLAMVNWRAWTVALAPAVAALVLAAWLGPGLSVASSSTVTPGAQRAVSDEPAAAPVTFEAWAAAAVSPQASVFLEPASAGDALLEAVLLDGAPSAGDRGDVQ